MSRVAVVTGGGSGLGQAISEHLARAGHHVAVLDRDVERAKAVAGSIAGGGGTAVAVEVDVAERGSVVDAYERVRAELGTIGILVTSAAVTGFVPFEQISVDDWERTLRVNLTGTFHCMQLALPDMVAEGWGRVVTISSAAGQTGALRQGHYSASKGGVITLTKTVALEYASKGITVNTIPPFTVDTPMLRSAQEAKLLPPGEVLARMVPAGRLGTPDDVAALCAFLCTDAAGYITGQVLGVNGGAVL